VSFFKKTLGVKIKKAQGVNSGEAWGVYLGVFFEKTLRFLSQFDQNLLSHLSRVLS